MRTVKITAGASVGILAAGILAAMASAGPASAGHHASAINPANFTSPKANPYYPLRPGTVSRLRGSDGGQRFNEQVTITHRQKDIQGAMTTVVFDVLRRADDGSLAEKTHDYYAADNEGNVWYFGEDTATYDRHGNVISRAGTWQAGVHGATAGLIMPADPTPTDAYRQEFFAGHAEDQAWIVQRNARAKVPYGTFDHVVRSFEWTRLETDVVSVKFYAPGVGIVREQDLAGGTELFQLVSVTHR
jgi:hypothetical protein